MSKRTKNTAALAVIAGGQGTRLFPIGHQGYPKQFCRLTENATFTQDCIDRFAEAGIPRRYMFIVVTNDLQLELAKEQTLKLGVLEQNILKLPSVYGYAGAMTHIDKIIKDRLGGDPVIVHTPADQYIENGDGFKTATELLIDSARVHPTILGINRTDLNTVMGCGNTEFEDDGNLVEKVTGFIEKPDEETAKRILLAGNTRVNTGINAWRASDIPKLLYDYKTELKTDVLMGSFGDELRVVLGDFPWYDCGTLDSYYRIQKNKTPHHHNASITAPNGGDIYRYNCLNSLFYTIEGIEIYASWLENDAVVINQVEDKIVCIVAAREASQQIGDITADFYRNRKILGHRFNFGINNHIARTNCENDIYIGIIGRDNYTVTALKRADSRYTFVISNDNKKA